MDKDEVLGLLRAHKAALVQRFGVIERALFGSFARARSRAARRPAIAMSTS